MVLRLEIKNNFTHKYLENHLIRQNTFPYICLRQNVLASLMLCRVLVSQYYFDVVADFFAFENHEMSRIKQFIL